MAHSILKKFIAPVTALTLAFAAQNTLAATTIRVAVFSPATEDIYTSVIIPWAKAIENDTKGTIKVELYPNGALGRNPTQQAQLVKDGVADVAFVVTSFSPGRFPQSEVLEMPGLFSTMQEGSTVFTRLIDKNVFSQDFKDYVVLAAWTTPPFSIHTVKPVKNLGDLKKLKIRASGSIQSDTLRALDIAPVAIPPTEVPEALARHTVDGATSQVGVIYDFGYDKVTKGDYFIPLGVVPLMMLMNKAKFDSLSAADQKIFKKYGPDWMLDKYNQNYGAYIAKLHKKLESDPKRTVVSKLSEQDKLQYGKAFQKVAADWEAKAPGNDALYQEVLKMRGIATGGK